MTKATDFDWSAFEAIANGLRDQGASVDEVLAGLRVAGAGPLHSLRVLVYSLGLNHGEAKVAVFTSPVWADIKPAHDQLEADIDAAQRSRRSDDIHQR